jgi:hypothetical protein
MLQNLCSRRRATAGLIGAIAGAPVLLAAAVGSGARAGVAKPIRWMFHRGPGVAAVAAAPGVARLLDNTQPYILRKPGDRLVIPPSWGAIPVAPFQAFDALAAALEQQTLAPEISGVLYDYEKWAFTPIAEQKNPIGYVKRAADLVRAQGHRFLTSPSANLVKVIAPDTGTTDAEMFEAYLRLGLAADGARYADAYIAQGQRALQDTDVFAQFIRQAAAQARRANPDVEVIAGISTNPIGRRVIVDDLVRAINATRADVDGYWMNIPTRNDYSPDINEYRPDIAIEVIRRVGG